MGEEKKVVTNINWSVCHDVEDSDMSTDIVWAEFFFFWGGGGGGVMCVCLCVVRVSKAPHSPNMFLSVHFAKTEEVVHDLTLSSLLVCCPQVQQTVNFRQTTLNKKHTVLDYAFDLDYLTVCFTREAVCLVLWLYPLVKTTENLTKAERLRTVVRQEFDLFIINGA